MDGISVLSTNATQNMATSLLR